MKPTDQEIEAAGDAEGERHWTQDKSVEDGDDAIALAKGSFQRGARWAIAKMEALIEDVERKAWSAALKMDGNISFEDYKQRKDTND